MRYTLRASNNAGRIDFSERLTIDGALNKVSELRAAGFERITLVNVETGLEITDLEQFVRAQPPAR